ncbi:MAG: 2-oxopent-4-enoate hydratase [Enterobacteriaceae bacterium]
MLKQYGEALFAAWRDKKAIAPLTDSVADLTINDAYRIQQEMVALRLKSSGEHIIGKKIGVTSKVVMEMLNVHQPDFGMLTSGMVYGDGATIRADSLIAPRAEGELAFILKRDLTGPGITLADVIAATEFVLPCFEIVDSRIADWKIRIQDTVADNASSGVFVLGDAAISPHAVELPLVGMSLHKNGEIVATGAGAAVMNHPGNAVAWLANMLGTMEVGLKAGEVILSGSLAAMVPVKAGDNLSIALGGVGSASVRFE